MFTKSQKFHVTKNLKSPMSQQPVTIAYHPFRVWHDGSQHVQKRLQYPQRTTVKGWDFARRRFRKKKISREEDFSRRRFLEKKILREESNSSCMYVRCTSSFDRFIRSYQLTGIDWLIQSVESINRFESIDWKKIFKIRSLLESWFYIFVVYGTCVHAHKSLSPVNYEYVQRTDENTKQSGNVRTLRTNA